MFKELEVDVKKSIMKALSNDNDSSRPESRTRISSKTQSLSDYIMNWSDLILLT